MLWRRQLGRRLLLLLLLLLVLLLLLLLLSLLLRHMLLQQTHLMRMPIRLRRLHRQGPVPMGCFLRLPGRYAHLLPPRLLQRRARL